MATMDRTTSSSISVKPGRRVTIRGTAGRTANGDASPRLHADRAARSEEHTSELQSQSNLVCRLLLEKKKIKTSMVIAPPPRTSATASTGECLIFLHATNFTPSSSTMPSRRAVVDVFPLIHATAMQSD